MRIKLTSNENSKDEEVGGYTVEAEEPIFENSGLCRHWIRQMKIEKKRSTSSTVNRRAGSNSSNPVSKSCIDATQSGYILENGTYDRISNNYGRVLQVVSLFEWQDTFLPESFGYVRPLHQKVSQ